MTTITPYICVEDSRAALEFYGRAFGAEVSVEPIVMDDGMVGHCEFRIGGAPVMMSDASAPAGVAPPDPGRGNAVTMHVWVDDTDAAAGRAREAGATVVREPGDTPHGRIATLLDPFGHRWMLNGPTPV